ncbi:hypothetical protein IC582_022752 [Cucumis melo]
MSLGYPKRSISTFVTLISIWNYLGRVGSGFLSEIVLTKYKFPRPLMLSLTLLWSCVGHLMIAFDVPNGLGSCTTEKQLKAKGIMRKAGEELKCFGGECFKLSFIIITVVTLLSMFISLILVMRTRSFYKSDIYKKFKNEAETEVVRNGAVEAAGVPEETRK